MDAVESGLRAVNLWNNGVADKQARAYSGGMKRRLSVAISFMGNPLVVYLDEPSTVRGGGGRGAGPKEVMDPGGAPRADEVGKRAGVLVALQSSAPRLCQGPH
jgi:hypothetical protein